MVKKLKCYDEVINDIMNIIMSHQWYKIFQGTTLLQND